METRIVPASEIADNPVRSLRAADYLSKKQMSHLRMALESGDLRARREANTYLKRAVFDQMNEEDKKAFYEAAQQVWALIEMQEKARKKMRDLKFSLGIPDKSSEAWKAIEKEINPLEDN